MTIFGQVRAVLQDVPSPQGWQTLCELLDGAAHDEAAMQELLPYCEAHLARWPDRLRSARKDVFERVWVGEPVPYWPFVRHLDLAHMRALEQALPQIHEQALFEHITHLSVEYCKLSARDFTHLLHVPGMATLTRLDISYCGLGEEGAEALAHAEHLEGLRELGLRRNKLKSKGGEALVGSKVFANLTYLDAGYNMFGQRSGGALLNHPTFSSSLDYLDLCYGKLGPKVSREFVSSDKITQVRSLNLRECGMEDDGLRAMIARDDLTRLEELGLCSNQIGDALCELGDASWFAQLVFLDLDITDEDVNEIRAMVERHAGPDLKIYHYKFDGTDAQSIPWRS